MKRAIQIFIGLTCAMILASIITICFVVVISVGEAKQAYDNGKGLRDMFKTVWCGKNGC